MTPMWITSLQISYVNNKWLSRRACVASTYIPCAAIISRKARAQLWCRLSSCSHLPQRHCKQWLKGVRTMWLQVASALVLTASITQTATKCCLSVASACWQGWLAEWQGRGNKGTHCVTRYCCSTLQMANDHQLVARAAPLPRVLCADKQRWR